MSDTSRDVAMLRAKLRKSLDKIGFSNGHAMPPSQSNIDPMLHELFIADEALAYWKQRQTTARSEVDDNVIGAATIEDMAARVTKDNAGDQIMAGEGGLYFVTLKMAKPANRLDQKALKNHLVTECGMSRNDVDAAFDACSKASAPAKTVTVMAR